ncbi:hypothetical protein OSB04_un001725 [Centaurea solstitialis]|uniref:Uncharacterized protein n=1 Tax=Centaurea solstitialis TaxID=347529 RepID=A0AA38S3V6_9ASTR|nr:hypothetical protein OSB04_un001725 [Centaurea solstitialis]
MSVTVSNTSRTQVKPIGWLSRTFSSRQDDFRSHFKVRFYLKRGAISLKSSKKDTIQIPLQGRVYCSIRPAKEAVWLRNFISDLRVVAMISSVTPR